MASITDQVVEQGLVVQGIVGRPGGGGGRWCRDGAGATYGGGGHGNGHYRGRKVSDEIWRETLDYAY